MIMRVKKGIGHRLNRISRQAFMAFLTLALLSAFGACATDEDLGQQANAEETLKIGIPLSLSGDFFEPASRLKDGYEFWADSVNDGGGIAIGDTSYQVQLTIQDDESDAATAARVADRLISEEEVDVVFGPFSSASTLTVGAITDRHQKVFMMAGAGADDVYEQGWQYAFGILTRASQIPGQWLEFMTQQSPAPTTLGIATRDDTFAQAGRRGLTADAEALGVEIIFDEEYSPDQRDFSTLVTQMSRAQPDVVAALGLTEDSAGVLRQMREQRYYPDAVFFSGIAMPDFVDLSGDETDYAFGLTHWSPVMGAEGEVLGRSQEVADAFEERFGFPPSYQNATAMAAGVVFQMAAERAGSLDPDALREAFLADEFRTFWGTIRYHETGYNLNERIGIEQVLDGEVKLVGPPDLAEAEPVYPAPGWGDR